MKVFIRKKLPGFGSGVPKERWASDSPRLIVTKHCAVVSTGVFRGKVAAAASSNHSLSRTIKLTKTIKPNGIYMRFRFDGVFAHHVRDILGSAGVSPNRKGRSA
jgi:hypothetical protein